MLARRALSNLALTGVAISSSCASPATEVTMVVDTDAPPRRPMSLVARARRFSPDGGAADSGPTAAGSSFEERIVRARIPGSFTVVPSGDRRAEVELELLSDVGAGATAAEPSMQLRRRVRFRFVPNSSQMVRVVLSLRCGERSAGCASVPADQCTVERVCEERGLTCGERGRCVPIETPVVPRPPEGAELDVSSNDASSTDAGPLLSGSFVAALRGVTRSNALTMAVDPVDEALFVGLAFVGAGSWFDRSIGSAGEGALVARIEPDGALGWHKLLDVGASDFAGIRGLSVSGSTLWTAGYYRRAAWSWDGAALPAASRQSAFSCALGVFDGAVTRCFSHAGSSANTQQFRASAAAGVAAMGGIVAGTWSAAPTLAPGAADDGFVTAYRSDALVFARRLSSDSAQGAEVRGVAVSSDGSVFAAGVFTGTLTLAGTANTWRSNGQNDGFVVAFAPDGALRWARAFGSPAADFVRDIALTRDGRVYAVGAVSGNVVGLEPLASINSGAMGGLDGFVVALDAATGAPVLARRYATAQDDNIDRVALDGEEGLLLSGYFGSSGLAPLPAYSAPVTRGLAILAVSADGTPRWAKALYHAGGGLISALAPMPRSRRVAFAASLDHTASAPSPSWAPSVTLSPGGTTGVFGAFSLDETLPAR
jgi:hypothetical protein